MEWLDRKFREQIESHAQREQAKADELRSSKLLAGQIPAVWQRLANGCRSVAETYSARYSPESVAKHGYQSTRRMSGRFLSPSTK